MNDKTIFNVDQSSFDDSFGDSFCVYEDRIEVFYGMYTSCLNQFNKQEEPNKSFKISEHPDYVIYFSVISYVKFRRAKNFLGIKSSGALIFCFENKNFEEKSILISPDKNEEAKKIADYINDIIRRRKG